jgi:uncharacterized protein YecE (DUF72 family)
MSGFIHGTAGWSYKDWVGPFYERGTEPGRFLEVYAESFPGVEVDSTYYRVPSERMTARWHDVTPEGFVFSPKMPGEITHERFLEDCGDLAAAFLDALAPLGEKLGHVVVQFPYFRKDSGTTLDVFLGRLLPFLDALPQARPRLAVEVRNKMFLKPALTGALRERGVALVLLDHAWMPPPEAWGRLEGAITTGHVPIRLIGDRYGIEKITKTWEAVVVDREDRLAAWAELIRTALGAGRTVTAFVNNHYSGHGPASARRLAELVGPSTPAP